MVPVPDCTGRDGCKDVREWLAWRDRNPAAARALLDGTAAVVPVEATSDMMMKGCQHLGCAEGRIDCHMDCKSSPAPRIWRDMLAAGRIDGGAG